MFLPLDIQDATTGMELNFDSNTPSSNIDIINYNNLLHSTSILPHDISSAELSADVSDEHAEIMPIISPVNSNLPCHFNSSSTISHEILTSPNESKDWLDNLPTLSSDEVSNKLADSVTTTSTNGFNGNRLISLSNSSFDDLTNPGADLHSAVDKVARFVSTSNIPIEREMVISSQTIILNLILICSYCYLFFYQWT